MNKSFCHKAWTHAKIDPTGTLRLCCIADNPTSHVSELDAYWNSDEMKEIRRKMVEGETVDECVYCYRKEDNGEVSPRISSNNQAFNKDEEAFEAFLEDTKAKDFEADEIESIDLRFGNLCNLRYKMCNPRSSSMIEKDYAKLKEQFPEQYSSLIAMNTYSDVGWENDEGGWDQLRKCIPHLKDVYFTGGEPTLIESNMKFIQECSAMGFAKDMDVRFTTNMTNINKSLIDCLRDFKSVKIEMSIDGVGAVQEYIRYPANWEKIKRNVQTVMELENDVRLSHVFTVQTLNILQITETFDTMIALHEASSKKHRFTIFINLVDRPRVMNLQNAPQIVKDIALDRLQLWLDANPDKHKYLFMPRIESLITRLKTPAEDGVTERIKPYMFFQDKTRKTTLEESIPELYRFL